MKTSFYDLSVGSYLQTLSGAQRVLKKGAEFAAENGLDPNDFVGSRLHDDMLPLLFQVNCLPLHSTNALSAIESGVFTPPTSTEQRDYVGLQALLEDTQNKLESLSVDKINQLAANTVIFKFGDHEIPFTAENFVLSFSLPNLSFHATTAYDILRHNGVPLSKSDYLGRMRIGVDT